MSIIVKNTTFANPFDLIAPHSCLGCGKTGHILCNRCKKHILDNHTNLCPVCHTANSDGYCPDCHNLSPIFIVNKKSSIVGDLIHSYKYSSIRSLARPLAELFNATLPPLPGPAVIVPLPTIDRHIRERGFDHTLLIAKHLARLRSNFSLQSCLIRTKNTVQVGSDRLTRIKQVSSAYDIAPSITINSDVAYILIDDVWTTGASLNAAYKKLRQAGANNIIIAALALSGI